MHFVLYAQYTEFWNSHMPNCQANISKIRVWIKKKVIKGDSHRREVAKSEAGLVRLQWSLAIATLHQRVSRYERRACQFWEWGRGQFRSDDSEEVAQKKRL